MKLITSLQRGIVALMYPSLCYACEKELVGNEQQICTACHVALPETKFYHLHTNPMEEKFRGRIDIQHATALYYFHENSRIQSLLHALKYQQQKQVGVLLGKKLGRELLKYNWIHDINILLPIPLSKQKMRQRGYNQSEVLCQGIGEELNLSVNSTALERQKNTKSQTNMNKQERLLNVRDAFEVHYPEQLAGKHVLLIDDVMTTGATLLSCAEKILAVAETKLSIATLAYTID